MQDKYMWNFGKNKYQIGYRYQLSCEFQYQLIGKISYQCINTAMTTDQRN